MKTFFFVVLLLAIAVAVLGGLKLAPGRKKEQFGKRPLLTKREQPMFFRLLSTFPQPEYTVLAQVSFGALLTAKAGTSRYRFAQKRADFVVLDKGLNVLAVIEFDDSSHAGREDRDADRDAMLTGAGYRMLRYKAVPDGAQLHADLLPAPKTESERRMALASPRPSVRTGTSP